MTKNTLLASCRLLFSLLAISAIITEIVVLIGRGSFSPFNFFSFFTIESNLFAAIILFLATVRSSAFRQNRTSVMLRGAATFYMAVTGVVFAVLLAGIEGATLTAVPWDNIVLHYIMPVVLVADWLIDPPQLRISFKSALIWLAYPLVYVAYSLVRGAFVDWYPYPFLNAAQNGYTSVALMSFFIALFGMALAWVLTRSRAGTAG